MSSIHQRKASGADEASSSLRRLMSYFEYPVFWLGLVSPCKVPLVTAENWEAGAKPALPPQR